MPDKSPKMNSKLMEESMLCDFECMPCIDTLQLTLHDILEALGVRRVYVEVSWCPVRAGWPSEDQRLVFLEDDRRIINAFCVPGIMLRALYLISHLIFATTL